MYTYLCFTRSMRCGVNMVTCSNSKCGVNIFLASKGEAFIECIGFGKFAFSIFQFLKRKKKHRRIKKSFRKFGAIIKINISSMKISAF